MCAAFEVNSRMLRPGKWVPFWSKLGSNRLIWAGFARSETLRWWSQQGAELVDIPADRFAERSDRTRQLAWDAIPPGCVIRGLIDPHGGAPLLKVVTRAATEAEARRFDHDRMPETAPPLFSADRIDLGPPDDETASPHKAASPDPEGDSPQMRLF